LLELDPLSNLNGEDINFTGTAKPPLAGSETKKKKKKKVAPEAKKPDFHFEDNLPVRDDFQDTTSFGFLRSGIDNSTIRTRYRDEASDREDVNLHSQEDDSYGE